MRFYYPEINKAHAELTGEAHTHAAYALRIRTGDTITVFDGKGTDYACKVVDIKKDKTFLEIIDVASNVGEAKTAVTLYLSVIKQDRFEMAVQKATELGINRIVPVYTTFTQRNIILNYDRLNKIAVAACEQCGRSVIPVIEQAIDFGELVERAKKTHMIFLWERELHGSMQSAIDKTASDVAVFVGPEGGITEPEKTELTAAGAQAVTLGKRILRAETAAIAALSVVYYEMGEWVL
ncbi:MAG: RsmE family RNA methyltransferase [Clostridia bacterium]|nr:RsmE family RNA methyltransferase [Clostridia bacterium]